jgi:hypothetical protein
MTRITLPGGAKTLGFGLLALGALLGSPASASDDNVSTALAAAEHAYQDVDFPETRADAERALETGHASPEQTARIHVLLGISAAALGDTDDAKTHFIAALAVDPTLHLDKSLSPKIRGPYLEAQGYWSASSERLAVSATRSSDDAHLVIHLQDPAALASKIELRLAAPGARERSRFALEPAAVTRFAVPARLRERDYEYVLRALDRYGNVLSERGSDADPELVHHSATDVSSTDAPHAGRSYFLPAALAVTGFGAIAAGVVFNVKREQAAHEWNGPSCEHPGLTRQQQCETVDSRVQSSERLAVGFYAGGGALLAGSVISLLAGRGPSAQSEHASALGCSVVGPGVSCVGSF